jgi:hypothetical protein
MMSTGVVRSPGGGVTIRGSLPRRGSPEWSRRRRTRGYARTPRRRGLGGAAPGRGLRARSAQPRARAARGVVAIRRPGRAAAGLRQRAAGRPGTGSAPVPARTCRWSAPRSPGDGRRSTVDRALGRHRPAWQPDGTRLDRASDLGGLRAPRGRDGESPRTRGRGRHPCEPRGARDAARPANRGTARRPAHADGGTLAADFTPLPPAGGDTFAIAVIAASQAGARDGRAIRGVPGPIVTRRCAPPCPPPARGDLRGLLLWAPASWSHRGCAGEWPAPEARHLPIC